MDPLAPFLDRDGVVILDGGLATELERRGEDLRDPLWSGKVLLEAPHLIRQVHVDYFVAGAQVATTASYQTTFDGLMQRGLNREQAARVLRLSVRLAQEARDSFTRQRAALESEGRCGRKPNESHLLPLIAASIGCYGASLHDGSEYRGDYGLSLTQLVDWHRPRMEVLVDAKPDLLACETVPSLLEGEALIRLLREFPGIYAWLSFSCRDGRHLSHGELFLDAVQMANESANIVAVGVNCTAPEHVEKLLESVAGVVRKPLVVYPNRGESWDAGTHSWSSTAGTQDWWKHAQAWYRAGARLIGGCCRTTPETIREIAAALGALGRDLPER